MAELNLSFIGPNRRRDPFYKQSKKLDVTAADQSFNFPTRAIMFLTAGTATVRLASDYATGDEDLAIPAQTAGTIMRLSVREVRMAGTTADIVGLW